MFAHLARRNRVSAAARTAAGVPGAAAYRAGPGREESRRVATPYGQPLRVAQDKCNRVDLYGRLDQNGSGAYSVYVRNQAIETALNLRVVRVST